MKFQFSEKKVKLPGGALHDLGLDEAGAAQLAVKPSHSVFRPLLDSVGDGILRQSAILATLFSDLVTVILHRLPMSRCHHLRHSGTHIKITQAVILVTQLIQLLHGHGIAGSGSHKQDQNLHIHHIMDKAQSLHTITSYHYYTAHRKKIKHNANRTCIFWLERMWDRL